MSIDLQLPLPFTPLDVETHMLNNFGVNGKPGVLAPYRLQSYLNNEPRFWPNSYGSK